jgi:DNA helicase-2/ATP-dependent DNA helicase PcrA
VAQLLAHGEASRGIVAFTFTEKAAAELKERITERVTERLGASAVDLLGGLFAGTIHACCFRLLQQHVPRYETFDVLDQNQLNAFWPGRPSRSTEKSCRAPCSSRSSRSSRSCSGSTWWRRVARPVGCRSRSVQGATPASTALERYRLLTFGQQVARAVRELERPEVAASVHTEFKPLVILRAVDAGRASRRRTSSSRVPGAADLVDGLPGDEHGHHPVLPDPVAIFNARRGSASLCSAFCSPRRLR